MSTVLNGGSKIGLALANQLGLKTNKPEGHDLAGPCIACKSSDAFRIHQQTGVAQCYSCGGKWSPFQIAEQVLGDREQAKTLLVELGLFEPSYNLASKTNSSPVDPLALIAKQKAISRESLVVFGAKSNSPLTIQLPVYGPDGKPCSTFQMSSNGGKGLFAKGKLAGLFFPHDGNTVRLPQPGETWYLVEGAKDAAALHALGYLVCGLNTCRLAAKFARLFVGVDVVLVPDRDSAGERGSKYSARVLRGLAKSIRIAVLPAEFSESGGADVRDILRQPGGDELVHRAIDDAQPVFDDHEEGGEGRSGNTSAERGQGGAATIAAAMASNWELWHTPAGDAYATIPIQEHHEHLLLKSRLFKRYVAKCFFEVQGKAISAEALSSAISLMEANALFDGEEHEVYFRVAGYEGDIYLDTGNKQWQVIKITSSGWSVISDAPVRFRRSRGMLSLPTPVRGGAITEFRDFLNVDDNSWRLVVGWLLATFRPKGPYPLLALFAEQGGGKSTAGRMIRSLVDPNTAPLRCEHRDPRDLMIGAENSWILAYDNLSRVPVWLSDALCRLSTGGGFATRELYCDKEEVIFNSQRPVLLTSIDEVATRSDLLDRCLIVWLPTIPEDKRRSEEEIMSSFEEARPRILGALLDTVCGALGSLSSTKLEKLPRMADFALWITAAEKSLGWSPGTFMATYDGNRQSANEVAIESSPIGPALLVVLRAKQSWSGTATELLNEIGLQASDQAKRASSWPKSPKAISSQLKRLAPNLRASGWEVEFRREASRRVWSIRPSHVDTSLQVTQAEFHCHTDSVQDRARQCKSPADDAHDVADAFLPTCEKGDEQSGSEWVEGEL